MSLLSGSPRNKLLHHLRVVPSKAFLCGFLLGRDREGSQSTSGPAGWRANPLLTWACWGPGAEVTCLPVRRLMYTLRGTQAYLFGAALSS